MNKKIISIFVMTLMTTSVFAGATSCNCGLERNNLISEKTQTINIRENLINKIEMKEILKNPRVNTVIENLKEKGYTIVKSQSQVLKNTKDETTFIRIPMMNSADESINEIYIILEDNQINKIISISTKVITNGVIFKMSDENDNSKSLIIKKGEDGRLIPELLNDKGIPIPLNRMDYWACVALCLFEFTITNWWYLTICGAVLVTCIIAPNPVSCAGAIICYGVPATYCMGFCLL